MQQHQSIFFKRLNFNSFQKKLIKITYLHRTTKQISMILRICTKIICYRWGLPNSECREVRNITYPRVQSHA